MDAWNTRQTIRSIGSEELLMQLLFNLLWEAFGVNREKGPRGGLGRTASSWQRTSAG